MTPEKITLPSGRGPDVQKDITMRLSGEKSKIHVNFSHRLFTTLSDYDTFFLDLEATIAIIPQIATKTTKDHEKIKNGTRKEIENLIQFIKASDHYRALHTLENLDKNTQVGTAPLIAANSIEQKLETTVDALDPIVAVLLANTSEELNKVGRNAIDSYYKSIIQQWCEDLKHNPVTIGVKPKNISLSSPLSNIIAHLFAAAKSKEAVQESIDTVQPTKKGVIPRMKEGLTNLVLRLHGIPKQDNSNNGNEKEVIYTKDIGMFKMEYKGENIDVLIKFVSNGKRLMNEVEGDIVFEKNPTNYDKNIPVVTINHTDYLKVKMK